MSSVSYAVVILGLVALIALHELGHFLVARAVGIRASRYFIGFPPRIWSRTVGDVEYGVGAIMLGGYVRLPGMFRPTVDDCTRKLGYSADELELRLDDLGHARTVDEIERELRALDRRTATMERDGEGSLRELRRLRRRVAVLIEDCHPRAFWRASLWRRMVVIAAGPVANVVVCFMILWIATMLFTPRFHERLTVKRVVPDSPAERAGIRAGDELVSWNGNTARDNSFVLTLRGSRGHPVDVVVDRDGRELVRHVVPAKIAGRSRLGIDIEADRSSVRRDGWLRLPPVFSASVAVRQIGDVTSGVVHGIARLVRAEERRHVTTVVGIVHQAPEVARAGELARYLALLSLVLAIFNLLPILPLDGGHLAFGLVELVRRGRPVARDTFERVSFAGLALMLTLFMVGLRNDLGLAG